MPQNLASVREIRFLMRSVSGIVIFFIVVIIVPIIWFVVSDSVYQITWRLLEYRRCRLRKWAVDCSDILWLDNMHCFRRDIIEEMAAARQEGQFHECILHTRLPFYTCIILFIVYMAAYVIFRLLGKHHQMFNPLVYPLHFAVWSDSYSSARLILMSGAWDVNSHYKKHGIHTPLNYVNCNNPQMVRLLLHMGADIRKTNAHLMYRAVKTGNLETLCRLVNAGIDNVNVHNTVQAAVILGKTHVLKFLVGRPSTELDSPSGAYNPLHLAVKRQRLDIVQILLDGGANPRALGYKGNTLAHVAAKYANRDLAEIIISKMGYLERLNWKGNTALHLAIKAKNQIVTKLLLDYGANIQARDLYRLSPLHMACSDSSPDMLKIIQLLVDKGAHINDLTLNDITPFHLAVQYQKVSTIHMLLAKGADPSYVSSRGETILHFAAANKEDLEVLKLFLSMGFDADARTTLTDSLVTYAAQHGAYSNYLFLLRKNIRKLDNDDEGYAVYRTLLATTVKPIRAAMHIEAVYDRCEEKLMDEAEELILKMADRKEASVARAALKYMALAEHRTGYNLTILFYEIEYHQFMKEYYSKCKKEILVLERLELLDLVFTLLTGDDQELLRYSKQADRWQKVWEHRNKFPLYYKLVTEVFYPLVRMQAQRQRAEKIICEALNLPDATHLVVEKILSYLQPADLANL